MSGELPIEVFNAERDVISGMHEPDGEVMWSVLNDVALADDELGKDELEKEAMGLLDIPSSIGGGDESDESWEVSTFKGVPQNPGLSRELGDGEEVDYFGAKEEGVDLPPRNKKNQDNKPDNDFVELIFENKNSYTRFIDLTKKALIANGDIMINQLNKLENYLRVAGKQGSANCVLEIKKEALWGEPGIDISGKRCDRGNSGGGESPSAGIREQKDVVISLMNQLRGYRVSESLLKQLADEVIRPNDLVTEMLREGKGLSVSNFEPIEQVAEKFMIEFEKLESLMEEAAENGKPEQRQPVAAPKKMGPIRPGYSYTYGPNPNGEGYVIVTAPGGRGVGSVILPGTKAYNLIRQYDTSVQESNETPVQESKKTPADPVPNAEEEAAEEEAAEEEAAEGAVQEKVLQPGEVRVSGIMPEKKRRIMKALKLDKLDNPEDAFARWLAQPFTLYREPVKSNSGRSVAIVDYGSNLPVDIRYDGIATENGKEWFSSALSKMERRDLKLKGKENRGVRQEMRRENRPSSLRGNSRRTKRREERQRQRGRRRELRRESARKRDRLLQIKDLNKIAISSK